MTSKQSEVYGQINYDQPPLEVPIVNPPNQTEPPPEISKTINPISAEILNLQLKSAAERRAGVLFRAVLKEFEHQMIARTQASKAELFVTAVLVLLAAERICCFIKQFDSRRGSSPAVHTTLVKATPTIQGGPDDDLVETRYMRTEISELEQHDGWPLSQAPEYYWQQGEQFSTVLTMMLKQRSVTPKMVVGQDGFINGRSGEDEELKAWLEGLKLTFTQLEAAKQKPFDADDNEFWELKWACKPFLA